MIVTLPKDPFQASKSCLLVETALVHTFSSEKLISLIDSNYDLVKSRKIVSSSLASFIPV